MLAFVAKVFPYIKPYRPTLLLVLGQLALLSLLELLKPWPLKIIIDDALTGGTLPGDLGRHWSPEAIVALACLGLIAIYGVLAGLTLLYNYTTVKVGQWLVSDLRKDLYHHLQRLSLSFHSRHEIGDLSYRVAADTYAIQSLTMNGLFPIVSATVLVLGMTVVMARLDWTLTIVALAVCPALFVAIARLNHRIGEAAMQARRKEGRVYSVVQQSLSAIRVVQAFAKEEEEHRVFMSASRDSLAASLKLYTWQTAYSGAANVLIASGTASVLWLGAHHVLSGSLTVGTLIVFTAYLASLYAPINSIVQTTRVLQESGAGVRRVFEILEQQHEIADGVLPLPGVRGHVRLEQVSFGYVPSQPVLRDISLEVPPGTKVAIVGATGAGKSTLVSLIPRFYDPFSGTVRLDGHDVRDYKVKDLREAIAFVLQPPLVFPVTLQQNIVYGKSDASRDDVIRAARTARIHDAIEKLPDGYDTVVGEHGVTLSEGERQRLTIARALLRDAPILIMDEPTSSVDVETEALIMEGLEQLMAGRTSFIIAHRLSTVRKADVIVVLADGAIVETGRFDELRERDGHFRRLYRHYWDDRHRENTLPIVPGLGS